MRAVAPGCVVLYRIHPYDIEGRHFEGNQPYIGEIVPLIVVKVWPHEFGERKPGVNGQLILDCKEGTLWVTSKGEGDAFGQWFWPE
jgi:hypothetical protein